jgi:choline-glycine betaine transporter
MFVFWAAQTVCLPASCLGRDERVWAVYVASVAASSPLFLPQPCLGFSFYASTFFECARPRLCRCTIPEVQFSHCFSSLYIAPHLFSLSSYVLSTYAYLFRASECGGCGAWVRCVSAVRKYTVSAVFFPERCSTPELLF